MTLSALSVASGSTPLALSPDFSPNVTEYTATVPDGVEEVIIRFSKTNPDADWGRVYGGGAVHELFSSVTYFDEVDEGIFISKLVDEIDHGYDKSSPQSARINLTFSGHPEYHFKQAIFTTGANYLGVYHRYTVTLNKSES